jgi:hypothetical protein
MLPLFDYSTDDCVHAFWLLLFVFVDYVQLPGLVGGIDIGSPGAIKAAIPPITTAAPFTPPTTPSTSTGATVRRICVAYI